MSGSLSDPELARRWAAGRLVAVQEAPYLATALLALQPLVVDLPDSLGGAPSPLYAFPVDRGWRVHVDPVRLAHATNSELAYWLLHQVGHLLRDHAARGERVLRHDPGEESVRRWNIATDLEIGDDLPQRLRPDIALRAARWALDEHRTAEEYLRRLAEVDLADARGCRFVDVWSDSAGDRAAVGADEARALREQAARRVSTWARSHDNMPGGWLRWAQQLLEPVVDWRRELSALVRRALGTAAGRVDHTYLRRSRREGAVPGVILSGLQQPRPVVGVVLDTSRSMSPVHLARAVAELNRIIRSAGTSHRSVRVICCDNQAYAASTAFDARAVRLLGGGGTDLREGLAAVGDLRPRPDLVVVLTDGETEWPEFPPPSAGVIVVLLGGERRPPSWARTVDIPVEDSEGGASA